MDPSLANDDISILWIIPMVLLCWSPAPIFRYLILRKPLSTRWSIIASIALWLLGTAALTLSGHPGVLGFIVPYFAFTVLSADSSSKKKSVVLNEGPISDADMFPPPGQKRPQRASLPNTAALVAWFERIGNKIDTKRMTPEEVCQIDDLADRAQAAFREGDQLEWVKLKKQTERAIRLAVVRMNSRAIFKGALILVGASVILFALLRPAYYISRTVSMMGSGGVMHKVGERVLKRGHYWVWALPEGNAAPNTYGSEYWIDEPHLDYARLGLYISLGIFLFSAAFFFHQATRTKEGLQ